MKIIVYVPGLGYDYFDISCEAYAKRYMSALDKTVTDPKRKFKIESAKVSYGDSNEFTSNTSTIVEITNEIYIPIVKFFEYEYGKDLVERFEGRNIFIRSSLLAFALLKKAPRFIIEMFKSTKTFNALKRFQSLYFVFIFLMIGAFGISILPALIPFIIEFINKVVEITSLKVPPIESVNQGIKKLSEFILAIFSLIVLFSPKFKEIMSVMATEFLCLDYYLEFGENKLNLIGKLESLIEFTCENEDFKSVEVHGYSFGSILLIDLIKPYGHESVFRVYSSISTIVTIGCPFNFINAYYPKYFKDRSSNGGQLKQEWYNIHSDIDVLSSELDSEKTNEYLGKGDIVNLQFNVINPKNINIVDYLMFYGLRAHRMFWGNKNKAVNFISMIIRRQIETKNSH